MSDFFQSGPMLGNQYAEDRTLQTVLRQHMPADVLGEVEADLLPFGDRVVGDIERMGQDAEAHPPRHVPFDPWGRRIDEIEVAQGWKDLDRVSAEEGIVATAYERRHGCYSRIHQLAKLYLFCPSSAIYSCPLAMTDGAARLIEVQGDDELRRGAFRRLISRDPSEFWTSGQWMTERAGGSDVSQSNTLARPDGDAYRLFGTKWFTSATTAQMAMTLARVESTDGATEIGSRGLGLFYLETRLEDGALNEITIHRLKDKLGTKALPTAELSLVGTRARLIGKPGEGVRRITSLINVTRVYNAVCAVAGMRRGLALARDYARRRSVFGKPLAEQPLHIETLASLQVELQGAMALVFHLAALMGREETREATDDESAVLRILTPIAKLYTAKQGVEFASEILESFGGAGYIEDTGLPRLLRDAQVLSIWEGTTNVLSLDVLRSMAKESALGPLLDRLTRRLEHPLPSELSSASQKTSRAISDIRQMAARFLDEGDDFAQASARSFAYSLARTTIAALLLEQACAGRDRSKQAMAIAERWCAKDLSPTLAANQEHRGWSRSLAMEEGNPGRTPATSASAEFVGAIAEHRAVH